MNPGKVVYIGEPEDIKEKMISTDENDKSPE
jgi:hypothetical protein